MAIDKAYWKRTIARNLQTLLQLKVMQKQELAVAIGKSPSYISQILKGEVLVPLDSLGAIASALGVSVFTLLDDGGADTAQIARVVADLPAEGKLDVMKYAKFRFIDATMHLNPCRGDERQSLKWAA